MAKINYNERSWAIDIISSINEWARKKNLIIKRAGGENTLKQSKETYFPDVLLYGDNSSGIILQGWELKMPDTDINDKELIKNAKRKAEILGLNSFLVWNVTTAVLYKIENDKLEKLKEWNNLDHIKKREDVFDAREEWEKVLSTILDDLNEFFTTKKIQTSTVIDSLTGVGLSDVILSHTNAVSENIKNNALINGELEDDIEEWWMIAKNEYISDKNKYIPLARLVLISWMNKLLFANLLKKYQKKAIEVNNIVGDISLDDAINIINNISDDCDFRNIFKEQIGEDCLPEITWDAIKSFNEFLVGIRLDEIKQDMMKYVLSNVVKRTSRRVSGQFSTPDSLADFLVSLVVINKTKNVLDPCCGTGTIPRACYDIKVSAGIEPSKSLDTIWASDKFTFPLQLAMLSMTHPEHIGEVVKIFNEDIFNLQYGKKLDIYSPVDGKLIDIVLPKMDYIVSNLPFVRQEDTKYLNKNIASLVNQKINKLLGRTDLKLDGKSDLYAYIPFILFDILNDGGKIGLIVSNSWLGVKWGETFYDLLQNLFDIETIIMSGNGRWFDNAKVVSSIMVLKKRSKEDIEHKNNSNITSYVTLNLNINDEKFNNNIKLICTQIRKDMQSEYFKKRNYSRLQEQEYLDMGVCRTALFFGIDWLLKIQDKLIPANSKFKIDRGVKEPKVKMCILKDGHTIEPEYIKKIISSPKEIKRYTTKPETDGFFCYKSIEELEQLNHVNTIEWIKSFENKVKKRPVRKHWYSMDMTYADICLGVNLGNRLFFGRLEKQGLVNQRLITFIKKDDNTDIKLCSALLNSILGLFYIEALGFPRGDGVLDSSMTRVREKYKMLNPDILNEDVKSRILSKYEILENRDIEDLDKELNLKDRIEFDLEVLSAYGIETYYDDIYNTLMQIYKIRVSMPK